jgi:hypothetical protein
MGYFYQHHNHSTLNLDFKGAIFMPIGKIRDITSFKKKTTNISQKMSFKVTKSVNFLEAFSELSRFSFS